MKVTTKEVLGYTLLPRVLPRFRELFSFAFSHTAYFIALLFEAVRLFPSEHPYLKKDYFGHYTVSQVLREAYKRLKFDRNHLDQVFIFFTICTGILLFFAQIILAVLTVFSPLAVWAGGTLTDPNTLDDEFGAGFTLTSIIGTQRPVGDDIAYMLLDRVFGVDDFFNSRVDPVGVGVGGFPFPYHFGLHTLFQTFSVAMLAVALLVLTYFVITILAETMRDGTPFGKRMNRVWAPIRLVAAFGLLIPLTNGLNAAQYIVLVSAQWGSNFATNGLTYFYGEIDDAGTTPFGDEANLVATPNPQDPSAMIQYMLTARACQYATQFYEGYYAGDDHPTIVGNILTYNAANFGDGRYTRPIDGYYFFKTGAGIESAIMPGLERMSTGAAFAGSPTLAQFQTFITNTSYESILIYFGSKSETVYTDNTGYVRPYCGAVSMNVVAPDDPMATEVQARYLQLVAAMWKDQEIIDAAAAIAFSKLPEDPTDPNDYCNTGRYPIASCPPGAIPDMTEFKARKTQEYKDFYRDVVIEQSILNNVGTGVLEWCGDPATDPYLLSYGWAGAAICYNKIASINGALAAAVANAPMPIKYPMHMDYVYQQRMAAGANINAMDRFNPIMTGENYEQDIFEGQTIWRTTHAATYEAYRLWGEGGTGTGDGGTPSLSGNSVVDAINFIFGTEGIFNMTKPENRDIYPLAQISSAGRALIEASIRNLGLAMASSFAGAFAPEIGGIGVVAGSFLYSFAIISMASGFVLFYVIPLMPFLYFFFAVAGWVKGIFEAMVGVPLWALAHLRIDGDGIPGQAAMTGYMLILEIFLRPILILFGLLASSLIFSGMAKLLNEMWTIAVQNMTGFDQRAAEAGADGIIGTGDDYGDILLMSSWRGAVDAFFFTVIYAIIIYMVAMASFKLVDLIPNFILRWLGQSVEAFGETLGDPAAQLSQKTTVGFSAVSSKMIGGAEGLAGGVSRSRQEMAGLEAAEAATRR